MRLESTIVVPPILYVLVALISPLTSNAFWGLDICIPTNPVVFNVLVAIKPLLLVVVALIVAKLLRLKLESSIVVPPILYVLVAFTSPFTSNAYAGDDISIPTRPVVLIFVVAINPLLLVVVALTVAKLLKLRFESTIVVPPILYVLVALISPLTSKV